jgi:hypothetical protein
VAATPQKKPIKRNVGRPSTTPSKTAASRAIASESETESTPQKQQVPRKLTRSASARRSKHVLAKQSDSESETGKNLGITT